LKLLEKNIGEILQNICIGKDFLNRTPIAQEIEARIDKLDGIEIKSFYTAKETINRVTRQPQNGRKIFASYSSSQRLMSRVYKELKTNTKRTSGFL
jgi:hypothetical protein